jgi:hypothetical protein
MTAAEKIINDCVSPFNEQQRQKLHDLSKVCKEYSAVPNAALEAYIAQLRDLYPEMFQNKDSLKRRVFFDEPRSVSTDCARFVRAKAQSPYRIVPVTL